MTKSRNLGNVVNSIFGAPGADSSTVTDIIDSDYVSARAGSGTGVSSHNSINEMVDQNPTPNNGTLHYVTANYKLYVKSQGGYYVLATLTNQNPVISNLTGATGGASAATIADGGLFVLTEGSNTVIDITAIDSDEGSTLTYSATLTSGTASNVISSPSLPVSNQSGNTFTLVPSTSGGGTITIRFDVTDSIATAQRTASFEISFIAQYSKNTTFLLTANGVAGNNNQFEDSSSNNVTVSRTGTYIHSTAFSPYRSGGYSTRVFSNNRVEATGFTISGSWTFEFWYKIPTGTSLSTYDILASFGQSNGTNCRMFRFMVFPSTKFGFDFSGGGGAQNEYTHTATYNLDQWYHICATYDSSANTEKVYIDGTEVYSVSQTTNYTGVTSARVGQARTDSSTLSGSPQGEGIFRDFHVIGNAAVAPASGGSPKVVLQSGSVLLLFSVGSIRDISTSGCTISYANSSNVEILLDTPYDYKGYDAGLHGASVYFNGTGTYGDFLYTDAILPAGAFTVSCWAYFNGTTEAYAVWGQGTGGNAGRTSIQMLGNNLFFGIGSTNVTTSSNTIDRNTWYYIDAQFTGSQMELFLNGVSQGTASTSTTPEQGTNFHVGTLGSGWTTNYEMDGYVADLKVVSGTPSGSSTVPTAPSSSSGAALHLKFEKAVYLDKSQNNYLYYQDNNRPVGNTSVEKFSGKGSIEFSGNQVMYINAGFDRLNFRTRDFTVEAWIKLKALNSNWGHIYGNYVDNGLSLMTHNNLLKTYGNYGELTHQTSGSDTILTTNWHHVAMTHHTSGSTRTLRIYLDGILGGSLTVASYDWNIEQQFIGAKNESRGEAFNGYLYDLRVSDFARYTASDHSPTSSEIIKIPSSSMQG